MKKRTWIAVHDHRFGQDTFHVACDRYPTEKEVVKYCRIDFEPNRETITITEWDEPDVVDIP